MFQASIGSIAPAKDTTAYAELTNVLSYIATEVHPSIANLFNPTLSADVQTYFRAASNKKLAYLESNIIGSKQFVVGNSFTVADAYLVVVLNWTNYLSIDLTAFPRVKAYFERINELPNVKAAHARIATKPSTAV
eukprot:gene35539-biopygen30231